MRVRVPFDLFLLSYPVRRGAYDPFVGDGDWLVVVVVVVVMRMVLMTTAFVLDCALRESSFFLFRFMSLVAIILCP